MKHLFLILWGLLLDFLGSLLIVPLRAVIMVREFFTGRHCTLTKPKNPLGKGAVVLVHGANMDRWCMFVLKRRLLKDGWGPVYDFELGPLNWTIEENAQMLKKSCEEIEMQQKNSARPHGINLIGHSMGGLVARYLVQVLNLGASPLQIENLITLGTPHWGTPVARLAFSRAARQMIPGDPFLQRLNEKEPCLPRGLNACFLWGDLDFMVPARWASWGKRLTQPPTFRCLPYHGHMSMLLTKRAYREVKAVLAPARPQIPVGA